MPASLGRVTAIAAGGSFTVALQGDGAVVCWGYNAFGQCDVPASLGTVAAIAAGGLHAGALKADGTVACWGRNLSGQCNVPGSLGPVAAIALGGEHSVALTSSGSVVCWGLNRDGQCDVPASLGTVQAIAAGHQHTAALRTDGSVVCWGYNSVGQCNVPPSLASATAITAGYDHAIAIVPSTCMTDVDGDGKTDAADLSGLLAAWGTDDGAFDLDGDGVVGAGDLSLLLSSWGPCAKAYPSLRAVAPNFGPPAGGTRIAIHGANLSAATSVKIGGVPASNLVVLSPSTIAAVTPPGALGTRDVTVTISGTDFILPSAFTYITAPAWATVLEAVPPVTVVPDATLRDAIVATGYPWRVRDNGTGIEMVLIPPGTFNMGCSASNAYGCWSDESPVHAVTLTNAFYLGRYEVTQAQWTARMGSNPSYFQPPNTTTVNTSRPVEWVSWTTIQNFLTATGMRLPTEAEWEYAYRAGTTTAFHGFTGYLNGTNDDTLVGNTAWYDANSNSLTRPVGGKAANGFGLHDMAGNVFEWVNDWYSGSYYATSPSTNPTGPASGSFRVLRGGSWNDLTRSVRSSSRLYDPPGNAFANVGFRVARAPL